MASAPITLDSLTTATVDGTGAFDVLMRAMTSHLELEFKANRLRGADYANVYLNSLTPVLSNATSFLLQKDEAANRAMLVEAQVRLTEKQIELAQKEIDREQQNVELIKAQVLKTKQETVNLEQELLNLKAQECVLKAQFDLTMQQVEQTKAQTALANQKTATEKAQTSGFGVEPDSVIGKQKLLYQAQTDGFKRDAEQKAAKLMTDTWNVRRTTDSGTVADMANGLADVNVGRAVAKMLDGVNA
jgi:DNA polymerase III gamma/tau subunit